MKILLHIAFLGTNYAGYQIQKNHDTVQKQLCVAAERVFGYPCDITGCSRTDSGVHANEFCAAVTEKGKSDLKASIPEDKIPVAFGCVLPRDIAVKKAEWVEDGFHPRYDVVKKEYLYKIYNGAVSDPFLYDRAWHYPRRIDDKALEQMREAAKRFVGKKDFSAYMSSGSSVKDTVRQVFEAKVERDGDMIYFTVSADGFLYNMVRIFMGTLIGVAEGKIKAEEIDAVTLSRDRRRAGITAPPEGLYLNRVYYSE